jgi:hypothetical protein
MIGRHVWVVHAGRAFDIVVPGIEIAFVVVVFDLFALASFPARSKAVGMWELLERRGLSAAVM